MIYAGYEIRKVPQRRPRTEPERFSGGVNTSAQERNRALLTAAHHVYVIESERAILVPSWFFAEFVARLRKEFPEPTAYVSDYDPSPVSQKEWNEAGLGPRSAG